MPIETHWVVLSDGDNGPVAHGSYEDIETAIEALVALGADTVQELRHHAETDENTPENEAEATPAP